MSLKQLTPIERYALHYLEYLHVSDDEKALRVRFKAHLYRFIAAKMWESVHQQVFYFCCFVPQEKLECSKRSWELQQLQRLKEEEQQQHMMEGDEDLFTYTREDAYNMVGGTV